MYINHSVISAKPTEEDPPALDVEELARAVRQAAAEALKSSSDTTAAAAAAKES